MTYSPLDNIRQRKRPKVCRICRKEFMANVPNQLTCSMPCREVLKERRRERDK